LKYSCFNPLETFQQALPLCGFAGFLRCMRA
jgi:hypothetical protein